MGCLRQKKFFLQPIKYITKPPNIQLSLLNAHLVKEVSFKEILSLNKYKRLSYLHLKLLTMINGNSAKLPIRLKNVSTKMKMFDALWNFLVAHRTYSRSEFSGTLTKNKTTQ